MWLRRWLLGVLEPWVPSPAPQKSWMNQSRDTLPLVPAVRRWRHENQSFMAICAYIGTLDSVDYRQRLRWREKELRGWEAGMD